ncbi:MAG: cellulase family glycosylhydrolase [Paludibacteraceae bacterium]|nr:cellulase family glycosylhydrolase [Paludibacteraceae bacterium]
MKRLLYILLLLLPCALGAQTWQAESASYQGTLQGGVVFLNDESDYVSFSISVAAASSVTVYAGVQSPYGDKVMNWQVGSYSGTSQLTEQTGTYEVNLGTFALNAGVNTIRITPNWTWFGVDYIRLTGLSSGGSQGGTTTLGGFHVSGNRLLDGYNQPFRMLGANLAYAWFKGYGYDRQMEAMRRAGANAVRIALSDGGQYTKDPYDTVQGIIAKAEALHMVAVLEVHDHTGSDDAAALQQAAAYWVEMKGALIGHEHSVIINIANEWQGTWKQYAAYESAYTTAIRTLRNAGIKHCLMVDAAGWGQEVASLTSKAQTILTNDPEHNIIFSIHMYETAGAPNRVELNINNVLGQGVALCIGEFAWAHKGEDVDEDAIISVCRQREVGWLAWSWWGNGSGLGYIDLVTNQYDEHSYTTQSVSGMSCNWGQKVMQAWAAEAETCTAFLTPPQPTDIPGTGDEPQGLPYSDDAAATTHVCYDLMGRPVAQPLSGHIYISNGKKYIQP